MNTSATVYMRSLLNSRSSILMPPSLARLRATAMVSLKHLTGKLKEAFNAQVTMELTAAAVYRQLSIDMETQ